MSRNKEAEFKDFLVAKRRSVSSGLTNVPVWIMQKAGKRIYSTKGKRGWRNIDMAKMFKKSKREEERAAKVFKSGYKKSKTGLLPKKYKTGLRVVKNRAKAKKR